MSWLLVSIFGVSLLIPWSASLNLKGMTCENSKNPCVCIYDNDEKIDLSFLYGDVQNFTVISNNTNVLFFNPCKDLSIPVSNLSTTANAWLFTSRNSTAKLNPSDVLKGTVNGTFSPIVKAESAKFENTEYGGSGVELRYTNNSVNLLVQIICLHGKSNILEWSNRPDDKSPSSYVLQLSGNIGCPFAEHRGLSTGSVLVVIFLTLTLAYLVGGCLILKYVRGAEGPEMIPNYEFWAGLPSLVRDGFAYLVSCGRVRPETYDRI